MCSAAGFAARTINARLKRDDAEIIQLSNILLTFQGSTPMKDGSRNLCGLRLNTTSFGSIRPLMMRLMRR
jgi:hypothetical protein